MVTPRLSKYEKALNRLARATAAVMVAQDDRTVMRRAETANRALKAVLDAHWEDHPEDCEWCARYPSLFA